MSASLWIALSFVDDLAILLFANAPRKRSATFSDLVAGEIGSPALSGDSIMATKTETVSEQKRLDELVAALKANRGTKKPGTLVERLADAAADSGRGISRIGAGFAAATENAALAFEAERDRQTRRTAQHLLALARS